MLNHILLKLKIQGVGVIYVIDYWLLLLLLSLNSSSDDIKIIVHRDCRNDDKREWTSNSQKWFHFTDQNFEPLSYFYFYRFAFCAYIVSTIFSLENQTKLISYVATLLPEWNVLS